MMILPFLKYTCDRGTVIGRNVYCCKKKIEKLQVVTFYLIVAVVVVFVSRCSCSGVRFFFVIFRL